MKTWSAIDLETDADVIGITGFVIHKRRMLEIAEAFRRRGKLVVAGGPPLALSLIASLHGSAYADANGPLGD